MHDTSSDLSFFCEKRWDILKIIKIINACKSFPRRRVCRQKPLLDNACQPALMNIIIIIRLPRSNRIFTILDYYIIIIAWTIILQAFFTTFKLVKNDLENSRNRKDFNTCNIQYYTIFRKFPIVYNIPTQVGTLDFLPQSCHYYTFICLLSLLSIYRL